MVSVEVLENSRCSHPTAHAHGHHAVARLATLELADNAGGQLGASATQRMAESDRATVRIHAFFIQTSFFDDGQRLAAKASLSSITEMSESLRPAIFSALGMAYTGPRPISSGLYPAV